MVTSNEKRRAREAVKRAVKTRKLVKPDLCEDCGAKAQLEAHHEDYSQPLDVAWICVDCHATRHDEAGDLHETQFDFVFRRSEVVQARYEDVRAYYDWRNWPPN